MVWTIQTLLEFTYYGNSYTMKFFNSASGTVLSKCSTSRFGVSQTLGILVSIYIIIAYIINFQVQSTPDQLQIKFALYIFGIHLWINWVLELKKVSRTTVSLALRNTGPRAQG